MLAKFEIVIFFLYFEICWSTKILNRGGGGKGVKLMYVACMDAILAAGHRKRGQPLGFHGDFFLIYRIYIVYIIIHI